MKQIAILLILMRIPFLMYGQSNTSILPPEWDLYHGYLREARQKTDEKNYSEALNLMDKAIEIAPSNIKLYFSKSAILLESKSSLDSVITVFDKILDQIPEYAQQRGRKISGSNYLLFYYHQSLLLFSNGNYEDAYLKLNSALSDISENDLKKILPKVYFHLGNASFGSGHIEAAISKYKKGFELEEYNEFGQMYYPKSLIKISKDSLYKQWNLGIERNPNLFVYYRYRGILYNQINKPRKALKDFQKAVELHPSSYEYINLAKIQFQLNKRKKARMSFAKGMELKNPYVYEFRNKSFERKEIYEYLLELALERSNSLININE